MKLMSFRNIYAFLITEQKGTPPFGSGILVAETFVEPRYSANDTGVFSYLE